MSYLAEGVIKVSYLLILYICHTDIIDITPVFPAPLVAVRLLLICF